MATFDADPQRARELGRQGGRASAAARKPPPAPGTVTILDLVRTGEFADPSWATWRVFLKAAFGQPLEPDELPIFQRHTGRPTPPTQPVREAWVECGRRAGKSRIAALATLYLAALVPHHLSYGERGTVMVMAADRRQARVVFRYLTALLSLLPKAVTKRTKETLSLWNHVDVEVHSSSFRGVRGYSVVGAVLDEIAFWPTDESANPDGEVLNAIRPAMLNQPHAMLLALSSPYAQRGALYQVHQRYFGQTDPRVLVWNADTVSMNPLADAGAITQAFADDPAWAASEYGTDGHVTFRADVQTLFESTAVQTCAIADRRELPPVGDRTYVAFTDPAGGSGGDSFTLAIAHAEGDRAVLDCVREVRPRFSPEAVVAEFAAVLAEYRISEVVGDRYAGEWPREAFQRHGVTYRPAEAPKSALYHELVPLVNAGRAELLDHPRLVAQLVGLERRVARGGRDSIDHAPGGHDDVANAAAGALGVVAAGRSRAPFILRGWGPLTAEELAEAREAAAFDEDTLARRGGVWMPGDPLPHAPAELPSRFHRRSPRFSRDGPDAAADAPGGAR